VTVREKAFLESVRAVGEGLRPSPPGALFSVSDVGHFETRGLIAYIFGQLTRPGLLRPQTLMLWGLTGLGSEKATLTMSHTYSRFVFARSDALGSVRAIVHFLSRSHPIATIARTW
jgi:hypothetical protein